MVNINKEVWRYLDNHITIKKTLREDLINVRALAKKVISDLHLTCSLNATISAIRRYDAEVKEHDDLPKVYGLLKKAKVLVRTKLASLLLKKTESVRIKEVNKYIKIIIDEKGLEDVQSLFNKSDIVDSEKNLGELTIIYGIDITKTPGVFALLSNELAANNVSIVDSTICHSEHLIIVQDKDLQKGFNVISGLTVGQ